MAYGVDGRDGLTVIMMFGHTAIGVFMSLKNEVYTIVFNQIFKDPTLDEIVISLE